MKKKKERGEKEVKESPTTNDSLMGRTRRRSEWALQYKPKGKNMGQRGDAMEWLPSTPFR